MKKLSLVMTLAVLSVPSLGDAHDWKYWKDHGHRYHHSKRVVVVREHRHDDGTAILAGVLGGIAAGVILDRVLAPSSPSPPQPVYYPPPRLPAPRDPYDDGYSEGYGEGVRRGRYERYEQGRRRGYEEGYEDARAGRVF